MTNPLLLPALRQNALFSSASAVVLLATAPWIAAQMGLASVAPVCIVAAMLAGFALQLWTIVRTGEIRVWEVRGIIAGDIGWVVASGTLAGLYYPQITAIGLAVIDVVAVAVLFFAVQQIRGLLQLRGGTASS